MDIWRLYVNVKRRPTLMKIFQFLKRNNTQQSKEDNTSLTSPEANISTFDNSTDLPRYYTIISTGKECDTGSIEGINSIPQKTGQIVNMPGYEWSIEYILQRKATEYWRSEETDLAIACLKKSNQLMSLNPSYWTKKNFLRLPEYLKKLQKYDEARKEEQYIEQLFDCSSNIVIDTLLKNCQMSNTDLVEATYDLSCSETAAKYRGRVYSISGKDARFPKLTQDVLSSGLHFYPFTFGVSIFRIGEKHEDPIKYSNRPFIDDRSEEEKRVYNDRITQKINEAKDRKDYDWIRENLSEIAPKSFGGYRRMKNSNSSSYIKLIEAAKTKGYII